MNDIEGVSRVHVHYRGEYIQTVEIDRFEYSIDFPYRHCLLDEPEVLERLPLRWGYRGPIELEDFKDLLIELQERVVNGV